MSPTCVTSALSNKFQRKEEVFSVLFLLTSSSHVLFLLTVELINIHSLLFVVWQYLESAMAASLALSEVLGSAIQPLPAPPSSGNSGKLWVATSLGYYSHPLDGCSQEPLSGNGFPS